MCHKQTVNQFAMVKCKCICHTAFAGNVVSQFAPLLEEVTLNQVNSKSMGIFFIMHHWNHSCGSIFFFSLHGLENTMVCGSDGRNDIWGEL